MTSSNSALDALKKEVAEMDKDLKKKTDIHKDKASQAAKKEQLHKQKQSEADKLKTDQLVGF